MKNFNIAITGIGYLSSAGVGEKSFYNLINNNLKTEILKDFDPQLFLGKKGNRYLNSATKMYCNLTYQCLEQNNLKQFTEEHPTKVGLYDGSELSNLHDGFLFDLIGKVDGPDLASPMSAPNTIANAASSQMAIRTKITGPNFSVSGGACGAIQALDIASLHLKNEMVSKAIVGSTEIITKYQKHVREGEKRVTKAQESNDQGVSFSIEVNKDGLEKHALIQKIATGSKLSFESIEDVVIRLIDNANLNLKDIDAVVFAGGCQNIRSVFLEEKLKINGLIDTPIFYPEFQYGNGDNVGGFLGSLFSIGLFKNTISPVCELKQGEFSAKDYSQNNFKSSLIITADRTGYCSITYLTKD
jgi:3-oxoacyl-[acyl-carrier-protein] synthase II